MEVLAFPGRSFGSSPQPLLEQVVGNTNGVRDDRERRIYGTGGNEAGGIHHIKVVEIVRFAMRIQHAGCGIIAHTASAVLMPNALERNALFEIGMQRNMRSGVSCLLQNITPALF